MFVRQRLAEMEISQSDFCRRSTFDQGLLSKIQNSLITSLSIESVLKLAVGLDVPPRKLFELIDRMDLHELVLKTYLGECVNVFQERIDAESPNWVEEAQKLASESARTPNAPGVRTRRRRWVGEEYDGNYTKEAGSSR
ncbi:MAG: helix-turn-helix domain-containing protein [Blastocatellales bacterium]